MPVTQRAALTSRVLPQRSIAVCSSAPTSPSPCRPPRRRRCRPRRRCRRRRRSRRAPPGAGSAPAVRGVSSRTATRSARAPTAIRPASAQPERRVPSRWRRASRSARAKRPRSPDGEPLVHLDRAHLLEQVDDRVLSRAEGQRAPGVEQRAGPGRCRRRGRARWSGRSRRRCRLPPSSAMSSSVRWVACTAVVARPSSALVGEQLGRGAGRRPRGRRRSRRAARRGARAAARRRALGATRATDARSCRRTGTARTEWHRPHRSARVAVWSASSAATRSAQASTLPSENRRCTPSTAAVDRARPRGSRCRAA